MTFPVYINILDHPIHPHLFMEGLAYIIGIALYLKRKRTTRELENEIEFRREIWILVGAIFGALFGSHLLGAVESQHASDEGFMVLVFGGKTVVGGLVGGWIGVELAKKILGIRGSTGDGWVFSLCIGMAIGRVGCFLSGLEDNTYGVATTLPWGVDFGDGISRHPTQLYEAAFVLLLFVYFKCVPANRFPRGTLFRQFMLVYLLMRLLIEFIKPSAKPYFGLSAIQVVCVAVVSYLIVWFVKQERAYGSSVSLR